MESRVLLSGAPAAPASLPETAVSTLLTQYTPAPPDNPLKGFAPYQGQASAFPHSLEFNYLPMGPMMTGPDTFNFAPLENLLDDVKSRGCQTVFRVFLEYPGVTGAIPQFLINEGLPVTSWLYGNSWPVTGEPIETPDYSSPLLRQAIADFIHEMGRRYDGDPRIAGITAGFLGVWGEWHDYPRNDLFASKEVQTEVMDAYEASFHTTPVMLRYPAGPSDYTYADNSTRAMGYHDDSFAYATLPTGNPADSWFFLPRMVSAGSAAASRWRSYPIGGEDRPENWDGIWNDPSSTPAGQAYADCVRQTHAAWLMDSSIVRTLDADQYQRAIAGERLLGYEFHVTQADMIAQVAGTVDVEVQVENLGVAPFYQDWPMQIQAVNAGGAVIATWQTGWSLRGLCPGDPARVWQTQLALPDMPAGACTIVLKVPNPMPGGKPLRFANATQDADAAGALTLGTLTIPEPAAPLTISGTNAADTISITASATQYVITQDGVNSYATIASVSSITIAALAGDDTITVGPDVMGVTIDGGLGDDSITGGDGGDSIRGDAGNDTIIGGLGDDTLIGNTEDDCLVGGDGADCLMGGLGADTLDGGLANDALLGGDGRDSILGGDGDDYIEGRGKMDTICAGAGNDTIYGGAGSDLIYGEDGDDLIDVGVSAIFHDSVDGGAGSDLIRSDSDDVLANCEGVWPV